MRKNENEGFIIVYFTGYDVDTINLLEVIDCLKQLGLIVVAEELHKLGLYWNVGSLNWQE